MIRLPKWSIRPLPFTEGNGERIVAQRSEVYWVRWLEVAGALVSIIPVTAPDSLALLVATAILGSQL